MSLRAYRPIVLIATIPLMAFSCVQQMELFVRPRDAARYQTSIASVKSDFDLLKSGMDNWAFKSGYAIAKCHSYDSQQDPLCSRYSYNIPNKADVMVTLEYSAEVNLDKITIQCYGKIGKPCIDVCRSINSILAKQFGEGAVFEYEMNSSYKPSSGEMQYVKAHC